jgi:hypothetical protein
MSSEPSTSWLPGGDDFVDVSDTFLEAAQGKLDMRLVKNSDALTACVDMELGDVILTEEFTLYDAMSALEAIRTRSHPRSLLMLVLFRSVTLAWTVGLFSMMKWSSLHSLHLLHSFPKKCVTY